MKGTKMKCTSMEKFSLIGDGHYDFKFKEREKKEIVFTWMEKILLMGNILYNGKVVEKGKEIIFFLFN